MSTDTFTPSVIPEEINYSREEKRLEIVWNNGEISRLEAELLRVESPSAEVQGHSPSQKQLVAGRRNVAIIGIDPVGSYAIRIRFDDLHDSGLFSWQYLQQLSARREQLWQEYEAALAEAGLSRDP